MSAVTILQGDCLKRLTELPSGSFDAVIADPPYGTTQNAWDSIIPLEPLWSELWRVCRGPVIMTASQPFTSQLVMSQRAYFRHEWIWIKNRGSNFANTVREPFKEHESVVVFAKAKWTYNKQMQPRTGSGSDRVKYGVAFKTSSNNYREFEDRAAAILPEMRVPSSWQKFNTEVGLHPTQKPVALFEYLIRTYTNEGDHVLDFSAGSGTTGVAAMNTGRDCTLIELNIDYVKIIKSRIAKAAPISDLFG